MTFDFLLGFGFVALSGIMLGCTALPMKYASRWKWENIWLVCTTVALAIIPMAQIISTAPQAWLSYRTASSASLVSAILFGLGWGVGSTLAGIGYTMLGIGLGVTIVFGLSIVVGSLLPLMIFFPARLLQSSTLGLYLGIAVTIVGLTLSAYAGKLRQVSRTKERTTTVPDITAFAKGDIRIGLLLCIASGLLSGMFNLALVFGEDIRQTALRLGASPLAAVNILWLPVQLGNFIVNLTYCAYLLGRNRGWSLYLREDSKSHWLLGLLMGILWAGSISIYGLGVGYLGGIGAIFGFPTYMSMSVVTANVAGLTTKEWQGSSTKAYVFCVAGMLTLIVAIILVSWANPALG
jgi:L-rhamnose-H+ transport protein